MTFSGLLGDTPTTTRLLDEQPGGGKSMGKN